MFITYGDVLNMCNFFFLSVGNLFLLFYFFFFPPKGQNHMLEETLNE